MKKFFLALFIGVLLLFTGFTLGKTPDQNKHQYSSLLLPTSASRASILGNISEQKFKVLKIIDGDTIDVDIDGRSETIRLIGIDTPEAVDPRKPVQCFGKEASDKAKELLSGKSVILKKDETQGERDKYGRLLRYVFLEDGTNFNKLMIGEGYAHEYAYKNNPYKYQEEFKKAEREATENKKGLWADNACLTIKVPPGVQPSGSNTSFVCNCAKTCSQIATCEEAYFQLNQCECSKRDADGDGVPCESLCR